ncbi:MAG: CheY-like chemotaxis protein [Sphingobacteriales bacterium]
MGIEDLDLFQQGIKKMKRKPIMLVEDDEVDVMTVKRALRDLKVENQLISASNGEVAVEYFENPENELPCFILLDLNMPRMNGIELLKIIKADSRLKSIPVIVLTTSNEERDKIESFKLNVAGYMIKPVEYRQFVEVIKEIQVYWTISEKPD